MAKGIVVFGLNGSGKTTLGRALAHVLDYKHMDVEDYYFVESDIPFALERTREEVIGLMIGDIKKYDNFIFSGVKGNYGDQISSHFLLGVFIEVPYDIRINRVEQRALNRFGDRVKPGGDMYESEKEFLEYVKKRNIDEVEEWSKTLSCPIIRVDGTKEILENIKLIENEYHKICCLETEA